MPPSSTASHRTHKTSDLEGRKFGDNAFEIGQYLSKGAFGRLHLGRHLITDEPVAIKLELKSAPDPSLQDELDFIKALQSPDRPPSIPRFIYYGQIGDWNALVLELFGANLISLLERCGGRFTVKTTIQILVQIIDIFAYVHSKNIVYRDVKPENFLIGRPNTGPGQEKIIRLVDFGLCKYFVVNGHHIAYKNNRNGVTGTARYASINNHEGVEQSRRDDFEALAYLAIFFLKGKLPWQGLPAPAADDERFKAIRDKKKAITTGFDEKPDYGGYKKLFKDLFDRSGFQDDNVYDWEDEELVKKQDSRQSKKKSKEVQDQGEQRQQQEQLQQRDKQDKQDKSVSKKTPILVRKERPEQQQQQRDNKKLEKKDNDGEDNGPSKKKPSKSG